jgi:arginyl-tRNA synthetase
MMKRKLQDIVQAAARQAYADGKLPSDAFPDADIEEPKNDIHGDFSTNLALIMAKVQKMAPRKIAEILKPYLEGAADWVQNVDIAGPGFINFSIAPEAWWPVLETIHADDERYGASAFGKDRRIQVEFVSSNPTGPLHVGHGRGAAVGDSVARILAFSGYAVQREYYINDSGRQIRTLGLSVLLRYRELFGETVAFPETCYQGDYIVDLAKSLKERDGDRLRTQSEEEAITACARYAAGLIIEGIRQDLLEFGVTFDQWFSEQSLYDSGRVDACIAKLREKQQVYEKDGALWFTSTAFGDEKDRVVVRNNGITTYFASDIAYHQEKFERGFDRVIDVWGADHHGYIPRMKAAVEASGTAPERFQVILVQLVNLLRGGVPVAMSTRAGEFVTLQDVVREVGRDAARFLFLTRHYDSPLDFDLEIAKQKSNDNPVYYVQYVHARIASIRRKAEAERLAGASLAPQALAALTTPEDIQLIKQLNRFPEVIEASARFMEPHRVTFYLMTLAGAFHSYYNRQRVLTEDAIATQGRLYLVTAVQKIIRNGLTLLGVSAPERM